MPNCERCGKYISGLEAERYLNLCSECYFSFLPFLFLWPRELARALFLRPLKKREKVDEEKRKKFLNCNVCGHFPLTINSISKEVYSNKYRIITKCPKCKDYEIKNLSKEELGKLDLEGP